MELLCALFFAVRCLRATKIVDGALLLKVVRMCCTNISLNTSLNLSLPLRRWTRRSALVQLNFRR